MYGCSCLEYLGRYGSSPSISTNNQLYLLSIMRWSLAFLLLAAFTKAHSSGATLPAGMNWENWHMKEEHQIQEFDAESFFTLHDLESKGFWNAKDILYIYGLSREEVVGDGSGMGEHKHGEKIESSIKVKVVEQVMRLLDANANGEVSKSEWLLFNQHGGHLPDFGTGPGHHMDFEDEYENHHWNKYHRDQDPDVHIKHKEDIEHEILHHDHEIVETHDSGPDVREMTRNFASPVKLENIPQKYLAE